MSANSNVVKNPALVEYGKFVELQNDSRFPPISVTRWDYRDSGTALSSVDIYPKYAVLSYLTNPDDIKVSLSAENININLTDIETLVTRSNTLLVANTGYTSYLPSISANVYDIESLLRETNTLLTANSSNTSYLIPRAYTTVVTTALTSKYFTNFGGVSGYLKNIKGINTTNDPSLPGTEVYLQIWSGDNNLTGVNSKLLFAYSVESESNFDIVFPDGIIVGPLWIVSSLTSITYTTAPDTLFLTVTYTT
ncbi:MAG: hypothetical protein ACOYNN_18480 [Terrimicrobiaceae bacterium]